MHGPRNRFQNKKNVPAIEKFLGSVLQAVDPSPSRSSGFWRSMFFLATAIATAYDTATGCYPISLKWIIMSKKDAPKRLLKDVGECDDISPTKFLKCWACFTNTQVPETGWFITRSVEVKVTPWPAFWRRIVPFVLNALIIPESLVSLSNDLDPPGDFACAYDSMQCKPRHCNKTERPHSEDIVFSLFTPPGPDCS